MTVSENPHTASNAPERSFKRWVYVALEDPLAARSVGKAFGVGLVVLIVLNALLVGVTDTDLTATFGGLFIGFSVLSTLIFGIEYVCRIWIADLVRPQLTPGRARARYVFSLMGIIDLLAFLPALFLYLIPASAAVNDAVRIIRLVRLIKISRYMRGLRSIGRVFTKHRQEIIAAFMVLALLAVASSVLMYQAEHYAQPEVFDSILTGLYWAMTTMTSTGYGDIVPITPLGRLVGFLTMVISIGVVAIPAGIFSAGFVEEFRAQRAGVSKEAYYQEDDQGDQDERDSEQSEQSQRSDERDSKQSRHNDELNGDDQDETSDVKQQGGSIE